MKTIKVIDLLNMISKGEEVPKKIKFRAFKLIRTDDDEARHLYIDEDGVFFPLNYTYKLDDEVEILEPQEHKIPEKLDYKYRNLYGRISQCKQSEIRIIDKINEILDYLEEIE